MPLAPLPEKIIITPSTEGKVDRDNLTDEAKVKYDSEPGRFFKPDDLTPEAREKYDAYYTMKAERHNPAHPGTAQAALDLLATLRGGAEKQSTEEMKTKYGFSFPRVIKAAMKEEAHIVRELAVKLPKDIVVNPDCPLVPEEVRVAKNIPEYVKPVEPVVVEK